jgi:hypothetical protein
LIKHLDDDSYHFLYFQSAEDLMAKPKFINKVKAKYPNTKHIYYLEKGLHILSKEEPANEVLFDIITKDVIKDHEK